MAKGLTTSFPLQFSPSVELAGSCTVVVVQVSKG